MSFVALAGAIGAGATALGATAGVASAVGAIGAGAIGGAGLGALGSAITGGDVGKGALFGALGGGITGGLGSAVGAMGGSASGAAPGAATGAVTTPVASGSSSLVGQGATNLATQAANAAPTIATSGTGGIAPGSVINAMGGNLAGAVPANAGVGVTNGLVTAANTGAGASGAGVVGSGAGMGTAAIPQAGSVFGGAAAPSYAGTFFGQNPLMTIGAGSLLGSYLGGNSGPTQATPPGQEWNPLAYYKFDARRFQPSRPTYIRTGYANGGIASLTSPDPAMMQSGAAKVNFMGEDAYPTSQQKLNFYASPTQMPTSAQQAMASYEPSTNPLTGEPSRHFASGGISDLGHYSDGGNLTRGPGDGVSDDIPATIAGKQPARLADGEFVVPARAVSELGNGSTNAGAKRLYDMVDRIQNKRKKSMGKSNIAVDSKARAALPA